MFTNDGVKPPPKTPRVLDEQAARLDLIWVKSPKSDALPVELMVIKSIVFTKVGDAPPPKTPRVLEEQAASPVLIWVKSPKSNAFPVEAMVM